MSEIAIPTERGYRQYRFAHVGLAAESTDDWKQLDAARVNVEAAGRLISFAHAVREHDRGSSCLCPLSIGDVALMH